jgi:hypothetical protein
MLSSPPFDNSAKKKRKFVRVRLVERAHQTFFDWGGQACRIISDTVWGLKSKNK